MNSYKPRKKSGYKSKTTKLKKSSWLFAIGKKIKNNFVAYYLLLAGVCPKRLQPYYRTFIYTFVRLIANTIIKIKRLLFLKDKLLKINLRKIKSYQPRLSLRVLTIFVILAVITSQVINIGAFEVHVINITAKIVNDIPGIEPDGGEYCNITGVTITLTSTSTIIYTLDGSNPVCPDMTDPDNGIIYTDPFMIYESKTVKARTCHDEKQSAIASEYFDVASQYCETTCAAETIDYWLNNEGCENELPLSNWADEINNLSTTYFSGAFANTTGEEICASFDLDSCEATSTFAGALCQARGQALTNHSNIVSGRLDLAAIIAGAFDNSENFNNLSLTASSTIEEALDKIENILINPNSTLEDLVYAGYVAQRIYTFYYSENPYAPNPICIYYEPGEVVLNEFVPNPVCPINVADAVIIIDKSTSMGKGGPPTPLSQAKTDANYFVSLMGTGDQSGLVSYSNDASLDQNLTHNHASTTEAINALNASGANKVSDAIYLANNELISVRANPAAVKAEILFTDGGAAGNEIDQAKAAAVAAAGLGIKIFTIGLGDNDNAEMLEEIASTTDAKYYFTPDNDDLEEIYQFISEELCEDEDLTGLDGEWTELYNKGDAEKDLANWMIANASATTTVKISSANTLSGSTTIGAAGSGDEWLVVLFNEARLSNDGDTIFLYDNIGHLLDFYSYPDSIDNDPDNDPSNTPGEENILNGDLSGEEGKSFARIPDGTGDWVDPIPTPGGLNRLEDDFILADDSADEIATSSLEITDNQNIEVMLAEPEGNEKNNFSELSSESASSSFTGDNQASELENNNQDSDNSTEFENQREESVSEEENGKNTDQLETSADLPAGEDSRHDEQTEESRGEEEILSGEENNQAENNAVEIGTEINVSGGEDNEENNLDNLDDNQPISSEETKTESAPKPESSEEESARTESSQEQATEPTNIDGVESPNVETTTL